MLRNDLSSEPKLTKVVLFLGLLLVFVIFLDEMFLEWDSLSAKFAHEFLQSLSSRHDLLEKCLACVAVLAGAFRETMGAEFLFENAGKKAVVSEGLQG